MNNLKKIIAGTMITTGLIGMITCLRPDNNLYEKLIGYGSTGLYFSGVLVSAEKKNYKNRFN